jgi:flagellar biosynthesis/type III secretory pathway chaperone
MADTLAVRLRALLDDERAALRDGALERLGDILAAKESLAEELAQSGLGGAEGEAEALRDAARRNAELLEAARAGLRAAMERMAERARLARSHDTYDAAGNRRALSATPGSLHRRL